MSCSSFPVATEPYSVRTPSSLTDLMFVLGSIDMGSEAP